MLVVVDFFEVAPVAVRLCGPKFAKAGSATVVLLMVPVEEAVTDPTHIAPVVMVTLSPGANPCPVIVNPTAGAMNRCEAEIVGAEVLGSTVKVEREAVGAPSSAERSAIPLALPALARALN